MRSGAGDPFRIAVRTLFGRCGIEQDRRRSVMAGAHGVARIDGVEIGVAITPLRRSRYVAGHRMGASTVGYRLTLESPSAVPVRCSVVHGGIGGSGLVRRLNHWRGIGRVYHPSLDADGLECWCSDAAWAMGFLDDATTGAIRDLMRCEGDDARLGHPCLFFHPGSLQYFRRGLRVESFDNLEYRLQRIRLILDRAASTTPPANPARRGRLERFSQRSPALAGCLVVSAVLGALGLATIAGIALVAWLL